MLFSIHTDQHIIDANGIFGYSNGYYRLTEHFSNFKYNNKKLKVVRNNKAANVQMFYMEPEWYNLKSMTSFRSPEFRKFYNHQYKIYGTYLEATKVWSHWIKAMNEVDEIWVGNKFSVESIRNSGIKTPTYVLELAVDKMWKPHRRGKNNKIRFLHVDSGSPRKRRDLVEKAFIELFGNRDDVELTLKFHDNEGGIGYDMFDTLHINNITRIYKTISEEEMYELYKKHDVLVYPSEGEGFGLIPLQALATGMPVISTSVWCDYDKYFNGNIIESKIGKTQHTGYFEGEVILPEYQSLLDLMQYVFDNIDKQCDYFYNQAQDVIDEYDWQKKCNSFLNNFINRVGVDFLNPIDEYLVKTEYVVFTGNGTYVASNGSVFSPQNRFAEVEKTIADGLLFNKIFRKATAEEIERNMINEAN